MQSCCYHFQGMTHHHNPESLWQAQFLKFRHHALTLGCKMIIIHDIQIYICKSYRRYLALPAVVRSRLFQLSLVFSGKPFPNTDLFSSSNSSCAYFSRLACSASSAAFLDMRVVVLADFGRMILRPMGASTLALGSRSSQRESDLSNRLDVGLSVVESFHCSKGGRFGSTAIRTGVFALFGSSLIKSCLILQNHKVKQSHTISRQHHHLPASNKVGSSPSMLFWSLFAIVVAQLGHILLKSS